MFTIVIALCSAYATTILHETSAFVNPPWRAGQAAPLSLPWHSNDPSAAPGPKFIVGDGNVGRIVVKTRHATRRARRLRVQMADGREGGDSSAQQLPAVLGQEQDEGDENYAYNFPTAGISLADQLEEESPEKQERFETTLTPVTLDLLASEKEVEFQYDDDGFPIGYREAAGGEDAGRSKERRHDGVARIDTLSTFGKAGEEPARWLVSLGDPDAGAEGPYAMVDLPPYSDALARAVREFMGPGTHLDVILLTSKLGIHYDDAPGVYVTRRSDLTRWRAAFPRARVVMYRLDVPRECRGNVTQVLDGYGPWGWEEAGARAADGGDEDKDEDGGQGDVPLGPRFVETGRPLRMDEWDEDTKAGVLTRGELPPDERSGDGGDDDEAYSPEAIRAREAKYRLLAVYTPGHTFGSVTYVFPRRGLCCSGYALPLESVGAGPGDDRREDEDGEARDRPTSSSVAPQGPRLDYRGYLATSASRPRQMSSALSLINNYIDGFQVVLPARGDLVFLESEKETRKRELLENVGLYQKMSDVYGRLGIVE